MTWPLIDDNTYRVLDSFRPFLGPRGNGIVEILTCLNEMLKSEPGQKMRDYLRSFAVDEGFQTLEVKSTDASDTNSIPLFFALALLRMVDTPLFNLMPPARLQQSEDTEYRYP